MRASVFRGVFRSALIAVIMTVAGSGWSGVWAQQPPLLILDGTAPSYPLGGRMEAHAEDDGTATLEQVRGRTFSAHVPPLTTGTLWLRLRVERAAGQPAEWLLALGEPDMDDVRVYMDDGEGPVREIRLGRRIPNAEVEIPARLHAARLILPEGRAVTLHLRLSSLHKLRVEDAALWRPAALVGAEARRAAVSGAHVGALTVAALVAALFGLWLRDGAMAAYALYIFTILCRTLVHAGLAPLIFSGAGREVNYLLSGIGLMGGGAALLLLWDRILDLGRSSPRLHRLFLGTAVLNCAGLLLVSHPAFHLAVPPIQAMTALGGIAGMVLALKRAFRHPEEGPLRLYLLAFVPVVAAWVVEAAARLTDAVPADLGRTIDIAAGLLHLLLLSGALGYRLYLIQHARLQAEAALVVEQLGRLRLRTFFDMAAHEFKTPLSVIDSAVQVLEMQAERAGLPANERFSVIRRAVRRLVGLIETCLAGERDGGEALNREAVCPADLVAKAVERNRDPDYPDVRAEATDPPETCLADSQLLSIALDALIDNARRYGPADGPVEIGAGTGADGGLVLAVRDCGPGIPEAERDKVFEKYYRGSSGQESPGTGLGLHLVKAVAEMHGGGVAYRPRDGGGSEFLLTIPVGVTAERRSAQLPNGGCLP